MARKVAQSWLARKSPTYSVVLTSDWLAPKSINKVVICEVKSTDAGCLSKLISWVFKFFRTLLTWDFARVGGRLTAETKYHSRIRLRKLREHQTGAWKISWANFFLSHPYFAYLIKKAVIIIYFHHQNNLAYQSINYTVFQTATAILKENESYWVMIINSFSYHRAQTGIVKIYQYKTICVYYISLNIPPPLLFTKLLSWFSIYQRLTSIQGKCLFIKCQL